MFEQCLLALAAGYEDINDHDELFHDPGFTSTLGTGQYGWQCHSVPLRERLRSPLD